MESVPLEGISSLLFSTQVGVTWLDKLTNISAWYWISISFCFVFSALFSASETALTALNYAKVQHLIAKDEKRYGRFLLWLQRPNRVLTTILIGNNLVNILASALVTSISEKVFGSGGVALAVGGLTLLILIAGEIVPKTFAKHHAQSVAMRLLPLLRIAYFFVEQIGEAQGGIQRGSNLMAHVGQELGLGATGRFRRCSNAS